MKKYLKLSIYIILLLIIFILIIVRNLGYTNITAEFLEMEPFYKNVDVYYKGFKLGRTVRIYPANDYKDTRVDIKIRVKKNILPSNIEVKLKSKGGRDYIDIIYPEVPSKEFLTSNSTVQGSKSLDIASYIDGVAANGSLDEITDNLNSVIKTAGVTLDALSELFVNIDSIILDIKPDLKKSSVNLAIMTENLSNIIEDLKTSTNSARIEQTFFNIESLTKNLADTTRNLEFASKSIANLAKHSETKTINLFDCVINNFNVVVSNINNIVRGVGETLGKRFAGLRIIFGRTID